MCIVRRNIRLILLHYGDVLEELELEYACTIGQVPIKDAL